MIASLLRVDITIDLCHKEEELTFTRVVCPGLPRPSVAEARQETQTLT